MSAPIVVGVEDTETARHAAHTAATLAEAFGAPLHLVMAVGHDHSEDVVVGSDHWHVDAVSTAEEFLEELIEELDVGGVTHSVGLGDPAKAICEEAERLEARTIVIGHRRVPGLSRVLGSVAAEVTRRAPCDVLIATSTVDSGSVPSPPQ